MALFHTEREPVTWLIWNIILGLKLLQISKNNDLFRDTSKMQDLRKHHFFNRCPDYCPGSWYLLCIWDKAKMKTIFYSTGTNKISIKISSYSKLQVLWPSFWSISRTGINLAVSSGPYQVCKRDYYKVLITKPRKCPWSENPKCPKEVIQCYRKGEQLLVPKNYFLFHFLKFILHILFHPQSCAQ